MSPPLLLHPVFDKAKAATGISDRKVVLPPLVREKRGCSASGQAPHLSHTRRSYAHLPEREERQFFGRSAPEPVLRTPLMASQPFVFPHRPPDQDLIQVTKGGIHGRLVKASVVIDPATQNRIEQPRQVF